MLITVYIYFSDSQGQITPKSVVVFSRISNSSILMVVLITCKNEEDLIKNEGARVLTTFSPLYKSIGIFPDAQGQLTPQSLVRSCRILKIFRNIMVVLVNCKNEEDPTKKEGARLLTRYSPL